MGCYLGRELGAAGRAGQIEVRILEGGYKAWRQYVNGPLWGLQLGGPRICIVGGRTGAGKTRVLHALASAGEQVIDLEGLANHKGSTFGGVKTELRGESQPSNEHFSNRLATLWIRLDASRWVFLEDEGPNVGNVCTPKQFYAHKLRSSHLVVRLVVPTHIRIQVLVADFADPDTAKHADFEEKMLACIDVAKKRL